MKCLLDHNIPILFKKHLSDFEVYTTRELGWDKFKNGILLQLMTDERFNVLITRDKNIYFQQNINQYPISILVLDATNKQITNYPTLIPKITQLLHSQLKTGITIIE